MHNMSNEPTEPHDLSEVESLRQMSRGNRGRSRVPNQKAGGDSPRPASTRAFGVHAKLRSARLLLAFLMPCVAVMAQGTAQQAADSTTGETSGTAAAVASTSSGTSLPAAWDQNPPGRIENPSLGTGVFPSGSGILGLGGLGASAARPATAPSPSYPLHWGNVSFHPHLAYSMLYGTGIAYGPGRQDDTFLNTVSPGITIDLGPRWSLDYTPSLLFYSSEFYSDTLDHAVTLRGAANAGNWAFNLGYSYASTSTPLIETAAQTDQETHSANLGADCQVSEKTSLELGLSQLLRFTQSYTDSYTWSTTDWLDYQWQPRLAVAVGVSLAYDLLDPGTDMTSQRILGRIRGRTEHKLSYTLQGGLELRQFLDTDAPTKISPNVDASLNYQLFTPTSLSVFVSHDTGTSYYSDQFTESTRMGGGINQRFLGRFFLNVTGGYTLQSYSSTFGDHTIAREDDNGYFQAGLTTAFLKRGGVSVFYRYSENASDQSGYSYNSNQIGLQLSYAL